MKSSRFRLLSPLLLLGIPALAMIWTDQVNWSLLDFWIMGVLLLALSATIRLIRRSMPNRKKWIYILFLIVLVFLLWVELGVGILNSPIAGN
jgi:hypothetical protein